jgi:hypothetical protein
MIEENGARFDNADFNELARKAAALTLESAEIPRLLSMRLGPDHPLTRAAEEMLESLQVLSRELRSFHASDARDRLEIAEDI